MNRHQLIEIIGNKDVVGIIQDYMVGNSLIPKFTKIIIDYDKLDEYLLNMDYASYDREMEKIEEAKKRNDEISDEEAQKRDEYDYLGREIKRNYDKRRRYENHDYNYIDDSFRLMLMIPGPLKPPVYIFKFITKTPAQYVPKIIDMKYDFWPNNYSDRENNCQLSVVIRFPIDEEAKNLSKELNIDRYELEDVSKFFHKSPDLSPYPIDRNLITIHT